MPGTLSPTDRNVATRSLPKDMLVSLLIDGLASANAMPVDGL